MEGRAIVVRPEIDECNIELMIVDNYADRIIGETLQKADVKKREEHGHSGKLSASALGSPLQWQILKAFGVPGEPVDEYTVRKFLRGNHVEEWYLGALKCVIAKDVPVSYRSVNGRIDAMVDTSEWDFPHGIAPMEVKSTSNANYKWILRDGPKRGHCLQGALYAMAQGTDRFSLSYIATDDYRVHTFIIDTKDWADEVERIITRFDEAKALGVVPEFVPEEKWQENAKYNSYTEWAKLTQAEAAFKLQMFLDNK